MNRNQRVVAKPTVREVLRSITPFVVDPDHEARFSVTFQTRLNIAQRIGQLAANGPVDPSELSALIRTVGIHGLGTLLSLLGVSQEEFLRHVTLLRMEEVAASADPNQMVSEWKFPSIYRKFQDDDAFAKRVLHLLLEGVRDPAIAGRVPSFLAAKLDGTRLASIGAGGAEALLRIGLKGAYDAGKGKAVVRLATAELDLLCVEYEEGEIHVEGVGRRMDIVIPDRRTPHVLIEVGVFATTARELTEKAAVEATVHANMTQHYPEAVSVRIVDGVGWIARGTRDLAKVIDASDYVLTQKTVEQLQLIVRAHVPEEFFGDCP